nr:HNH endonuclease signature motif containing protein [Ornithinimicrobium flavum]
MLRRGVAGTKGQPTTSKATVVVSIDLEVLQRLLSGGAGGDLPGCGATLDGASVTAATIRRMACDADIIPVVLGTDGEIVDQGRAKRLVTPGQRVRLALRDQTCTIPGCTVPATWCDAHHVVPWSRGGRSDLSNYALLCPRHHTWVHERELTATVTDRGVTWHLR